MAGLLSPCLALCLTLCLAVAGCGYLRAGAGPGAVGPRPPGGRAGPAAVASYRLAAREAQRLLAAVQVPPGSVRITSAPRALNGPAMGRPSAGASLIDKMRMWRVPMSSGQAQVWFRAHLPKGLPQNGSMSAAGAEAGLGFAGPRNKAWQSAELDLDFAPAPGGSVIRADGVVIWLDPRPMAGPSGGVRMRLTVAGGCPASDRQVTDVSNGADVSDWAAASPGRPDVDLMVSLGGCGGISNGFIIAGGQA